MNSGSGAITQLTGTISSSPTAAKLQVTPIDDSLVACWHFDEEAGNKAKDVKQGLEVNLNGNWANGKFGSAYKFVGSGWVGTNFGTGIGNGVTYVFWFKLPDTSDTYGTFFCTEDVSDTSLEDNLGQTTYGDAGCGVS